MYLDVEGPSKAKVRTEMMKSEAACHLIELRIMSTAEMTLQPRFQVADSQDMYLDVEGPAKV